MSEYKSDEMLRKEAADRVAYEAEDQRYEEEAKRKNEVARSVLDDVTQDERRAAARASAQEEKRKANEKANDEVAKKEAERKANLKPGQADFELLLEGLRTRINGMQLNKDDTAKFSATIDQLKATSGYVAEPKAYGETSSAYYGGDTHSTYDPNEKPWKQTP